MTHAKKALHVPINFILSILISAFLWGGHRNDDEACIVESGVVDSAFQKSLGGGGRITLTGGQCIADVAFP